MDTSTVDYIRAIYFISFIDVYSHLSQDKKWKISREVFSILEGYLSLSGDNTSMLHKGYSRRENIPELASALFALHSCCIDISWNILNIENIFNSI